MAQSDPAAQDWSAEGYARNARFVADFGADILGWLDPGPGMAVLDLGCGDGALTERIAASGARVVGVDGSPDMVEAAKRRGLDARVMDGQNLTFDGAFDAVFSNAALHWMTDAAAVAAGVARALRPRGRFVAEFGGHGNVAAIATALRAAADRYGGDRALAHPWYFPTPEAYRAVLERAGFSVSRIELYPRPTSLQTGVEGWLETFREPFFDQFTGEDRQRARQYAIGLMRPSLCDEDGNWVADYVRLRVDAVKAGGA